MTTTTEHNKNKFKSLFKAYQKEHARIRRADLQEAIHAYNMHNQKRTDEAIAAYNENLKEEAYKRIKKKMTNDQIMKLFEEEQEGKQEEYINSLTE